MTIIKTVEEKNPQWKRINSYNKHFRIKKFFKFLE